MASHKSVCYVAIDMACLTGPQYNKEFKTNASEEEQKERRASYREVIEKMYGMIWKGTLREREREQTGTDNQTQQRSTKER